MVDLTRFDRGVKKLFGAYTQEDEEGLRYLDGMNLRYMLEDMQVLEKLINWDEVSDALAQTSRKKKGSLDHHEFKKFLKKIAVSEFKKPRYNNKYPSHDERYRALLEYLGADDVESLLSRAHRSGKRSARSQGVDENSGPPSPRSVSSEASTTSNRSSSSQRSHSSSKSKGSKSSSKSGRSGSSKKESLEQRIERRVGERLAKLEEQRQEEERMRQSEVDHLKAAEDSRQQSESGLGARGPGVRGLEDESMEGAEAEEIGDLGVGGLGAGGLPPQGWDNGGEESFQEDPGPRRGSEGLGDAGSGGAEGRGPAAQQPRNAGLDDDLDDDGVIINDDDDEESEVDRSFDIASRGLEGHREAEAQGPEASAPQTQAEVYQPSQSSGGGRPVRPQSAGRHLSRPESARPQSSGASRGPPASEGFKGVPTSDGHWGAEGGGARPQTQGTEGSGGSKPQNQGGAEGAGSARVAQSQGTDGAGSRGAHIVSGSDSSTLARQPRSKVELRCTCGGKSGSLHLASDMSWLNLSSQLQALFGMPSSQPVLFTYKGMENGAKKHMACSNQHDLTKCFEFLEEYPPKNNALKVAVLFSGEEGSSDDDGAARPNLDTSEEPSNQEDSLVSEPRDMSMEADKSTEETRQQQQVNRSHGVELQTRVEYNPSAPSQPAAHPQTLNSPRPETAGIYTGQTTRPPRPQSATSRPQSAPRTTKSGLESFPSSGFNPMPSAPSAERKNMDLGSDMITPGVTDNAQSAQAPTRVEQSGIGGGVQPELSAASRTAYDKLRSCIALGVLPAKARLCLEVEYCTVKRPSVTLRGSSKKYVQYYTDLKKAVGQYLMEWDIETVVATNKPRIGAFEVTLSWLHNGYPYKVLLFSKLTSRLWPNVNSLIDGLAGVLPRFCDEIKFRVLGGEEPVSDAHIVVQDPDTDQVLRSAYTDPDGYAHVFLPLPESAKSMCNVRVNAQGFGPEEALMTLLASEANTIRLSPRPMGEFGSEELGSPDASKALDVEDV